LTECTRNILWNKNSFKQILQYSFLCGVSRGHGIKKNELSVTVH